MKREVKSESTSCSAFGRWGNEEVKFHEEQGGTSVSSKERGRGVGSNRRTSGVLGGKMFPGGGRGGE